MAFDCAVSEKASTASNGAGHVLQRLQRASAQTAIGVLMGFDLQVAPGFSNQIGRFVTMMNSVRCQTLKRIGDLTTEELDHRYDGTSNSIGMLISHIVALEMFYSATLFEARDVSVEDSLWGAGLRLGTRACYAIRGYALEFYVDHMRTVRERTLAHLRDVQDDWLDRYIVLLNDTTCSNAWALFHLIEEEAGHLGQIRWLHRRLPTRSAEVLPRHRAILESHDAEVP